MKSLWIQVLVIVLLGVGAGLLVNQLSPRGIPWLVVPVVVPAGEFIPLDQAVQAWHRGNVLFLDAREPADYAAGHIGNALNLPAQSFAEHFGEVAPLLTSGSELILYCDGTECDLSRQLAAHLRQQGYVHAHILANGWAAWQQAGLPATGGKQQ